MAVRIREATKKIVEKFLADNFPDPKYGTVTAIDTTNHKATVQYAGETGTATVFTGAFYPAVGAVVKIEGKIGKPFVTEILSGTPCVLGNNAVEVRVITNSRYWEFRNNGNAYATGAATWTNTSARATKTNISEVDEDAVLAALQQVNVVLFDYKDDPRPEKIMGMIADEMDDVFPSVVSYDEDGHPDGIGYGNLTPMLIAAVQALTARVAALEALVPDPAT